MSTIFFYGLFMDKALLEEQGLHPSAIGPARLSDYRIHIGDRATLIPSVGSTVYGIVMSLSDEEAESLYAAPSVSDYRPESVDVDLIDAGEVLQVLCYNLPQDAALVGANSSYATKLSKLANDLCFESTYVDEIARFSTGV
jgi:hypothetical protein